MTQRDLDYRNTLHTVFAEQVKLELTYRTWTEFD